MIRIVHRFSASALLVAEILVAGTSPGLSQNSVYEGSTSALIDKSTLPIASEFREGRLRVNVNESAISPAATEVPLSLQPLVAPPSLALPDQKEQVQINELRPLTLEETLLLAEVNSPKLKAALSQVDQAKLSLRAKIAFWYPTVDFSAGGLPAYFKSYTFRNPDFLSEVSMASATNRLTGEVANPVNEPTNETYAREWRLNASLQVSWDIINPRRVPQIAAARDRYERARRSYLISLRDLRLETSIAYFNLQEADEGVRIGQTSVRASLISLRDARARFNAGVNTKLEVLEAETQLARDRSILASKLGDQNTARRSLASKVSLPQNITPTAATPGRPLGSWKASLQESISAAYAYREELDQLLLDISISNSEANASLAAIQPILSFVNTSNVNRREGQMGRRSIKEIDMDDYAWAFSNTTALTLTWRLFDGGHSHAEYSRFKRAAKQNAYQFARKRDDIRLEVEQSFFGLRTSIQNIQTTASEVLSSRESLLLSQLRVQAGVSTQREVVNNQRDLTNAELRYASAIRGYNTGLVQLGRRTGLDALLPCSGPDGLPSINPEDMQTLIPIEPMPFRSVCPTTPVSSGFAIPSFSVQEL
ncbi:TolC family protein [Synechococcus sp. M16CYN]|uniref:TolC family protein n=1 Tax=Synechococcus sp. M16CYN TaxID=3103139 RepID=UPI00324FA3F5